MEPPLDRHCPRGRGLRHCGPVFLVVVIIGYILPWFGTDLLNIARGVADFNLPARVGRLFGVSL